jgi:phosphate-selective porin OprO/OprP
MRLPVASTAVLTALAVTRVWSQTVPDSAPPSTTSVEQRLDSLARQVKTLEHQRDSAAAAAKTQGSTSATKDGFVLKSGDGKYQLRLRGLVQTGGRFYLDDDANLGTNQFLIRRARPIFDATIAGIFDFRLQVDFGQGLTTLYDAYVDLNLSRAVVFRAGKFKPPIGLERLQATGDVLFIERGLPTNLVPTRDIGLQLSGVLANGRIAYQIGIFDGTPDLTLADGDLSDAKDGAARVFLLPFPRGPLQGLGLGVGGSTGIERGTVSSTATSAGLPSYRSPGQLVVFRYRNDATAAGTAIANGHRSRLTPQGYFYLGSFGLLGEYNLSWQEVERAVTTAKLMHSSWQLSGSYFLTGEKASFRSATPKHSFDPKAHTWGALEIAARYGELKIDDAAFPTLANPANAISKEQAWGLGLNWYFLRALKWSLNYERTTFTGGAATGNRASENALQTQFQCAF